MVICCVDAAKENWQQDLQIRGLIRAAYQALSDIEYPRLDEEILDSIFSRFCVGK